MKQRKWQVVTVHWLVFAVLIVFVEIKWIVNEILSKLLSIFNIGLGYSEVL